MGKGDKCPRCNGLILEIGSINPDTLAFSGSGICECMNCGYVISHIEFQFNHRTIYCPNSMERNQCNGNNKFTDKFEPCEDCPIDWQKLRVK